MTSTTSTPDWVDDYLARIGALRPASADLKALRDFQLAHLLTVPFENLSIHLGEPIVLNQADLVAKVTQRHRGGFCYELNGAFAGLLTALGFRVSLLSARVFGADGQPGPPFDHMTLRVDLAEPWLVDVGFGRFAGQPLQLGFDGDQPEPGGTFRVVGSPSGPGDFDVFHDGEPAYRVDPRPCALSDFAPTCWWHQTFPGSHFRQSLTCSISTGSGRITLSGDRLIVTEDGHREEHTLASDPEILAAYRHYFGITLDRVPVVNKALSPRPHRHGTRGGPGAPNTRSYQHSGALGYHDLRSGAHEHGSAGPDDRASSAAPGVTATAGWACRAVAAARIFADGSTACTRPSNSSARAALKRLVPEPRSSTVTAAFRGEPGEDAYPVGDRVPGQRPVDLVDSVHPGVIVHQAIAAHLPWSANCR